MADSPLAVWSVFIGGVLAAMILLAGFVAAVVLSQRRYLNLHRSHARKILETQEEERAWVSREVHDDAVQRVGFIGRECETLRKSVSADQADRLRAIQDELRDLGTFLRGLAHRLHPPLIDHGGLPAALAGLCEEVERVHGVQVRYRAPPEEQRVTASPQAAIVVYRIAQEALQNVVKHAAVTSASLELSGSPERIELVVRDRGKGFDSGPNHRPRGIGLMGMRERAFLAAGHVVVTSTPGEGTEVRATIPAGPERVEPPDE